MIVFESPFCGAVLVFLTVNDPGWAVAPTARPPGICRDPPIPTFAETVRAGTRTAAAIPSTTSSRTDLFITFIAFSLHAELPTGR